MIRKFILLVLTLISISTIFSGCSVKQNEEEIKQNEDAEIMWDDGDGVLEMLAIGNSFSDDALEYFWDIATDLGIKNVIVGNLYIGGCDIDRHYTNLLNNNPAYEYRFNSNGTWDNSTGYSSLTAIKSRGWDFITIQQVSGLSGNMSSYNNFDAFVSLIKEKAPKSKIVWHQTWAYQQYSTHQDFARYQKDQKVMFDAICDVVQTKVVANKDIYSVIPSGTAIQNARATKFGDNLTRDGYHLNDLGRYIAALTYVYKLTNVDIANVSFSPLLLFLNEEEINLCVESVKKAVENPYMSE